MLPAAELKMSLSKQFLSSCLCGILVKTIHANISLFVSGKRKRAVKVEPWGDSGGLSPCQGPRCGAGHPPDPQRPPPWPPSGNPCGGCVYSDWHHLWTHHGTGKASAFDPPCAWRLSLPAVWQVRSSKDGWICPRPGVSSMWREMSHLWH